MNRSFRLITIRGIDLRLHITFPLILGWAALQFGTMFGDVSGAIFGVVAITILFALVTLHELGHSFAAMAYGVPVKQIILTPIGGMAQLMRMPEKPVQELVIAIAGPAVNVLMAILMIMLAYGVGIDLRTLLRGFPGAAGATILALFSYVFISNIFLAVFNMLPAFPMDGGRVLRALLALRLDYAKATTLAANVGRVIAVLLGIYALANGNFFLIFIAMFIFGAATQEARHTATRHVLRGHTVQQAYSDSAYRLDPSYTLQQAANMMTYTGQQDFAVVYGDKMIGFLPQTVLRNALRTHPAHTPVSAIMVRDMPIVNPNSDLYHVQQRLMAEGLNALPVASDSGRYLGVITRRNIAELFGMVRKEPNIIIRET